MTLAAGLFTGFGLVPQPDTPLTPLAATGVEDGIPVVPPALWNVLILVVLVAGLVTGGLAAVVTLFGTGFQTGLVADAALAAGIPMGTVVWLIAQHALLEVSGLLLAGSLGLRGFALLLRGEPESRFPYMPIMGSSVQLILVGALVEAFLTPLLAGI